MCDVGDVAVAMGVRWLRGCGVQKLFKLVVAAESPPPTRILVARSQTQHHPKRVLARAAKTQDAPRRVLARASKTRHDPKQVLARAAKTRCAPKRVLVSATKTRFWQGLLAPVYITLWKNI